MAVMVRETRLVRNLWVAYCTSCGWETSLLEETAANAARVEHRRQHPECSR